LALALIHNKLKAAKNTPTEQREKGGNEFSKRTKRTTQEFSKKRKKRKK
jgi:hypothetical protein